MPRTAWTLTDNSTGSPVVYSFVVNPNEFSPPGRDATISEEISTAPNGNAIVFQGRDKVQTGKMSGTVFTSQQYTDITIWMNKWVPLQLTDDLGNTWAIVIRKLSWDRVRRLRSPYRHNYSVEFTVL